MMIMKTMNTFENPGLDYPMFAIVILIYITPILQVWVRNLMSR